MADGAARRAWGPVLHGDGRVSFRIWAPGVDALLLRANGADRPMERDTEGWFSRDTEDVAPGDMYCFVLPGGESVPDPAARAQAGDVHGPSRLTDPEAYDWQTDWSGRPWAEAVIYELHVGTFTDTGTFRSAIARLDHLAETGITAIELLPVAQFGGDRGWGYDGVLPYAPHPAYGSPDDLKALIDAAHCRGLMVLLDVVYNHFGPDGNYLGAYAPDFFDPDRQTPWGAAIDFTKAPVRRFVIDNVLYWLEEFRLDGLRFDAIDHIADPSEPEIMIEAAQQVRARITDRPVHLTTEDNRNVTYLHERSADGSAPRFTAEWNDDLHNVAHTIATHEADGYYADFSAHKWQQFARSLAEGFAYQGEVSPQTGKARGYPSGHLPPLAFVDFLQNHDQIGNRAFGERLCALTDEPMLEALTAILLLSPHVPLLFMGEEYGEERPFCFFAGFDGDLGRNVTEGRRREFAEFDAFQDGGVHHVPDPIAPSTFEACKLDWNWCAGADGQAVLARTRKLLALRVAHLVPHLGGAKGNCGRVLSYEEGAIAVDWQLDGALLQLRANLSDTAMALPEATGEQIHATGDLGAAHSACHYVQSIAG